jgi:hypothetical protein
MQQNSVEKHQAWLDEEKRVLDKRKKEMDNQEYALNRANAEALRLKNEKDAENADLRAIVEELKLENQLLEDNLVKKIRHDEDLANQLAKEREEDEESVARTEDERITRLLAESEVLEKVAKLMAQVQVVGEPLSPNRNRSGHPSAPPPTPSTPPSGTVNTYVKDYVETFRRTLTPEEEEAIALAARLRNGNAALQNSARFKVEKAMAPMRISDLTLIDSESDDEI